jgi:hypothetical protein
MTRDILECIAHELDLPINRDEVRELEDKLFNDYDDFFAEIDGQEYRFIHEDYIWEIYKDEIQETTEQCYFDGTKLNKLWWLAIDWEQTAENCFSADGYGHHFAYYDGSEYEHKIGDSLYYIFRTN